MCRDPVFRKWFFPYYMQYYVSVKLVFLMGMPVPVCSGHMQFDITGPHGIADPYACVQEIGALVLIKPAGEEYAQWLTIGSLQIPGVEILM